MIEFAFTAMLSTISSKHIVVDERCKTYIGGKHEATGRQTCSRWLNNRLTRNASTERKIKVSIHSYSV